jgi:hypothetical protein
MSTQVNESHHPVKETIPINEVKAGGPSDEKIVARWLDETQGTPQARIATSRFFTDGNFVGNPGDIAAAVAANPGEFIYNPAYQAYLQGLSKPTDTKKV